MVKGERIDGARFDFEIPKKGTRGKAAPNKINQNSIGVREKKEFGTAVSLLPHGGAFYSESLIFVAAMHDVLSHPLFARCAHQRNVLFPVAPLLLPEYFNIAKNLWEGENLVRPFSELLVAKLSSHPILQRLTGSQPIIKQVHLAGISTAWGQLKQAKGYEWLQQPASIIKGLFINEERDLYPIRTR